jgi:hypothetical protein
MEVFGVVLIILEGSGGTHLEVDDDGVGDPVNLRVPGVICAEKKLAACMMCVAAERGRTLCKEFVC